MEIRYGLKMNDEIERRVLNESRIWVYDASMFPRKHLKVIAGALTRQKCYKP